MIRSKSRMPCLRRCALVLGAVALLVSDSHAQSAPERIRRAFSLVGRWEIVKMDAVLMHSVSNPSTIPQASLGSVTVNISSSLGGEGYFDVAPGGAITGRGLATYTFHIAAGSTAFSAGPATSPLGFSVVVPVGAAAVLKGGSASRPFAITGQADLAGRKIALNAFQPAGGQLPVMIVPGGRETSIPAWPPMTNIAASEVIVNGASLLLRVSGSVRNILLTFEAVKYVDLAPLLEDLMTGGGPAGPSGPPGPGGPAGPAGGAGSSGPSAGPGAPVTASPSDLGAGGSMLPLAGSLSVGIGSSATVTFRAPLPTDRYAISLTPERRPDFVGAVSFSNKSRTGFTVNVAAGTSGARTGSLKVDWVVVPYP